MYIFIQQGYNPLANKTEEPCKMNKETKQVNKKLYIILLACTIAAIIAIVAISLAVGLSGTDKPQDPIGGIDTPEDPDDKPEDPDDPDDPDEPTVTVPEYGMPVASYTLGKLCSLDELIWSDTLHWYATHNGTDFLAESGTAVGAVYDGEVTEVRYTTQDGYTVTIAQTDGHTAVYKSLGADVSVEAGDVLSTGDAIGTVSDSMTSEQNDGAHLHLEILDDKGNYVDPLTLLPEGTDK